METKDTTVKNVLIAEFMGLGNKQPFEICEHPKKNTDLYFENQLNYHKDWNWLMPVVAKIESLNNRVEIARHICRIGENIVISENLTKIEAVYNAVVEFIKWYNQNK